MARVLLLIPTASYRAPDFMAAAAELDVDVVVGSDQRSAVESFLPGSTVALPLGDPDAAADAIEAFAEEWPLEAIVAVDDGGTLAAARASQVRPSARLRAASSSRFTACGSASSAFRRSALVAGSPGGARTAVSSSSNSRTSGRSAATMARPAAR